LDSTDTVIAGVTLLLIVPPLLMEIPAYRKGGYNAEFWKKPLDERLDHIAAHPDSWTRMGAIWLPILVLSVAGTMAFSFQLAAKGAETWAFLAMGAYIAGSAAWLIGSLIQTTAVRVAAQVRAQTGTTPDWLDAGWTIVWWSEITYVIAANVAFIAWGVGMLDSGFPADWMGWAAIALGVIALLLVGLAREAFPHLGVIVPIVLGIALVAY